MERKKITTEFPDAKKWGGQIQNWMDGLPTDIYARYDSTELRSREKQLAEMIGTSDAALFNSGMGAIVTAMEAEELKSGDVVLCGKDVYSETAKYFKDLKKRGIRIILIDSGNAEEIEQAIGRERPRLIVLESTGNSPEMPVCDLKRLGKNAKEANNFYHAELNPKKSLKLYLERHELLKKLPEDFQEGLLQNIEEFRKGQNPFVFRDAVKKFEKLLQTPTRSIAVKGIAEIAKFISNRSREKLSLIVDNTLSSPAIRNPFKELEGSGVEMVVVESGTKHYQKGQDKITLGIAYSNKGEKIERIRAERAKLGTYLQPVAEKEIPTDIAEAMPEIMKRHGGNALTLARILEKSGNVLDVGHPNLEKHKNSEIAKEIAPEGLVSVFYIQVPDAEKFVGKVKELGGDSIGIGGSFGHPKTWLFNLGENNVRIAAGSESPEEFEKILDIFKQAVAQINEDK
ncbi:MAG: PLP-dependent transferase [Candidatus Moranbacteria bacterium]|nr:PLP-dependent transferase [Candidatus Moranbacteria bacterium]